MNGLVAIRLALAGWLLHVCGVRPPEGCRFRFDVAPEGCYVSTELFE